MFSRIYLCDLYRISYEQINDKKAFIPEYTSPCLLHYTWLFINFHSFWQLLHFFQSSINTWWAYAYIISFSIFPNTKKFQDYIRSTYFWEGITNLTYNKTQFCWPQLAHLCNHCFYYICTYYIRFLNTAIDIYICLTIYVESLKTAKTRHLKTECNLWRTQSINDF